MTNDEFSALLTLGYEQRGVEFKGPGQLSDAHYRSKVIRAMLGMANGRDGGHVIIGVEETGGQLSPVGLSPTELAGWRFDDIADQVSRYADPTLTFDREELEHEGKRYVVLRVHEFDDIPILCKGEYQVAGGRGEPVLRRGACYVRSRRKPETSEIPTHEDMRRLLDLAVQKGIRNYVALSMRAGVDLELLAQLGDDRRFAVQRSQFEETVANDLLAEIRSRGHWQVVIRPIKFEATHVSDFAQLLPLVDSNRVSGRTWSFPYVDYGSDQRRGPDWLGQETSYASHLEIWRLYQSGQFVYLSSIWTDWTDRTGAKESATGNKILPVLDTIGQLTEIFEFATRLGMSAAGDEALRIEVQLSGLSDRALWMENPARTISRKYTASKDFDTFSYDSGEIRRTELVAAPAVLALSIANQLFVRFGLHLEEHIISDLQKEAMRR